MLEIQVICMFRRQQTFPAMVEFQFLKFSAKFFQHILLFAFYIVQDSITEVEKSKIARSQKMLVVVKFSTIKNLLLQKRVKEAFILKTVRNAFCVSMEEIFRTAALCFTQTFHVKLVLVSTFDR